MLACISEPPAGSLGPFTLFSLSSFSRPPSPRFRSSCPQTTTACHHHGHDHHNFSPLFSCRLFFRAMGVAQSRASSKVPRPSEDPPSPSHGPSTLRRWKKKRRSEWISRPCRLLTIPSTPPEPALIASHRPWHPTPLPRSTRSWLLRSRRQHWRPNRGRDRHRGRRRRLRI